MEDMRKSHISSPRWAALLIAPLLVAGLAACSNSDETPAEQASPSTVTETVTETASPEQDSGDAEDQDDKSQDAVSDAQDLRVTAEGQGVLFLRLDNESSVNDDSKTLEGELISGPGGCLSVQPGGRPEMLVFDADTEFGEHPPRVTVDGETIKIGQRFSLQATEVSSAELTGVPERCSRGAADKAWIVGTN